MSSASNTASLPLVTAVTPPTSGPANMASSSITGSTSATRSSAFSAPSELSKESLNRLAASLPKYLSAGGVVLAFLIVVGLLSWWWKRRKRRARFFDDDEEIWALPRTRRRGSDASGMSGMSGMSDMEKMAARSYTSERVGRGHDAQREDNGKGSLRPPDRVYSPDQRRTRDGRRGSEEALIGSG